MNSNIKRIKKISKSQHDSDIRIALLEKELVLAKAYRYIKEEEEKCFKREQPPTVSLIKCQKPKPSRIPVLCKNKPPCSLQEKFFGVSAKNTEHKDVQKQEKTNFQKFKTLQKETRGPIETKTKCKHGPLQTQFQSTSAVDQFKQENKLQAQFHSTSLLDSIGKYKSRNPEATRIKCDFFESTLCNEKTKSKYSETGKKLKKKDLSPNETPQFNNQVLANSSLFPQPDSLQSYDSTSFLENELKCVSLEEQLKLLSSSSKILKKNTTKGQKDHTNSIPSRAGDVCAKGKIEPPRFVQMSAPNKRYVLANWKYFKNKLPPEMLARFDKILKSCEGALDPEDASRYFKLKKQLRKKKEMIINSEEKDNVDGIWLTEQIDQMADVILEYFQNETPQMLNFMEMIISDEILVWLENHNIIKLTSRSTKDRYIQTVIDICDKIVTWMTKMNYCLDSKPISSEEEIILTDLTPFTLDFAMEEIREDEEDETTQTTDEGCLTPHEEEELMQFSKIETKISGEFKSETEDSSEYESVYTQIE